mgnify:CR=1 FL=1
MVKVEVCVESHCALVGGLNILESLEELREDYPEQIEVEKVECLDICDDIKRSPVVKIDGEVITSAKSEVVMSKVMERIQK